MSQDSAHERYSDKKHHYMPPDMPPAESTPDEPPPWMPPPSLSKPLASASLQRANATFQPTGDALPTLQQRQLSRRSLPLMVVTGTSIVVIVTVLMIVLIKPPTASGMPLSGIITIIPTAHVVTATPLAPTATTVLPTSTAVPPAPTATYAPQPQPTATSSLQGPVSIAIPGPCGTSGWVADVGTMYQCASDGVTVTATAENTHPQLTFTPHSCLSTHFVATVQISNQVGSSTGELGFTLDTSFSAYAYANPNTGVHVVKLQDDGYTYSAFDGTTMLYTQTQANQGRCLASFILTEFNIGSTTYSNFTYTPQ